MQQGHTLSPDVVQAQVLVFGTHTAPSAITIERLSLKQCF